MKNLFFRRLIGSFLDKIIIVLLFLIISLAVSPYAFPGEFGRYVALLKQKEVPSKYKSYDENMAMRHAFGDKTINNSSLKKWSIYKKRVQNQTQLVEPFKNRTLFLDLKITSFFILLNFIYYFFGEWVLHISLGKYFLGLTLASEKKEKLTEKRQVVRLVLFLFLMLGTVGLRFVFDLNYYVVILFFFLLLDIPVFLKGRSLIDIVTNTYIVKRHRTVNP